MYLSDILSASWETYNERKASQQQNEEIFCPDDPWEFNFLVEKIVSMEPHLDELTVMLAVRQSMRQTMAPRPRKHFVQTVIHSIADREAQWAQILQDADYCGTSEKNN
jgi:hypothetical protein